MRDSDFNSSGLAEESEPEGSGGGALGDTWELFFWGRWRPCSRSQASQQQLLTDASSTRGSMGHSPPRAQGAGTALSGPCQPPSSSAVAFLDVDSHWAVRRPSGGLGVGVGTEPFIPDGGGSLLSTTFPTCPGSHESRPGRVKAPRRTLLGDKLGRQGRWLSTTLGRISTGPACRVNKAWLCLASRPCSCPCLCHRQLLQPLELL